MKVLEFRPYKKVKDSDLLIEIYHIFDRMRVQEIDDDETRKRCDQLIREAKLRQLKCSKENLYHKILYK